ncbi:hypothetical protein BD779DRAFT_1524262 [Infundibulicybe gibba]|nr:hypothetical protein BD779DRAFT_1524262 [Infundibulicybe gibba]
MPQPQRPHGAVSHGTPPPQHQPPVAASQQLPNPHPTSGVPVNQNVGWAYPTPPPPPPLTTPIHALGLAGMPIPDPAAGKPVVTGGNKPAGAGKPVVGGSKPAVGKPAAVGGSKPAVASKPVAGSQPAAPGKLVPEKKPKKKPTGFRALVNIFVAEKDEEEKKAKKA